MYTIQDSQKNQNTNIYSHNTPLNPDIRSLTQSNNNGNLIQTKQFGISNTEIKDNKKANFTFGNMENNYISGSQQNLLYNPINTIQEQNSNQTFVDTLIKPNSTSVYPCVPKQQSFVQGKSVYNTVPTSPSFYNNRLVKTSSDPSNSSNKSQTSPNFNEHTNNFYPPITKNKCDFQYTNNQNFTIATPNDPRYNLERLGCTENQGMCLSSGFDIKQICNKSNHPTSDNEYKKTDYSFGNTSLVNMGVYQFKSNNSTLVENSNYTSSSTLNEVPYNLNKKAREGTIKNIIKSTESSEPGYVDDENGHIVILQGQKMISRFSVNRIIGQGTFGRVMECFDSYTGENVAVKVVRSMPKYHDAAVAEIRVLNNLQRFDPSNLYRCIAINEAFMIGGHVCLVFELLGPSIYDFMKANSFHSFSIQQVQEITHQLVQSISYVHSLGLIHTDLKPENILFVSGDYTVENYWSKKKTKTRTIKSTKIKIIDFGSSVYDHDYHPTIVSTRHYRSPEVILDLGWSYPCDMWSIGCIIIELLIGEALFQTHDNLEHLVMMEKVIETVPQHMIRRLKRSVYDLFYLNDKLDVSSIPKCKKFKAKLAKIYKLSEIINPKLNLMNSNLHNLVYGMMNMDPHTRTSAIDALKHEFFKLQIKKNDLIPQESDFKYNL
ncbi:hypothetical protein BB559_004722 [Furculomyces boomerangus]|uniref:Protein kinase domain-containing protein n=1 Tax=Furculomyces boomerangus TaxID=61424 RepID=A0A2T9YCZ8_9FUNG|nr:hypothetical protein BB559_004722 [Furculomyces boomerangus]